MISSIVALQRDCLNYIRVLQVVDDERLYVCGTHAFQPQCDYLVGQRSIRPQLVTSGGTNKHVLGLTNHHRNI